MHTKQTQARGSTQLKWLTALHLNQATHNTLRMCCALAPKKEHQTMPQDLPGPRESHIIMQRNTHETEHIELTAAWQRSDTPVLLYSAYH
jgi:hypothetical protein